MKSHRLYSFFAYFGLILLSTQFPDSVLAQGQLNATFQEIYPTSVEYSIINIPVLLVNQSCNIKISPTQESVQCANEVCLCNSGVIEGLTQDTTYNFTFETTVGSQFLTNALVKTAAYGRISTNVFTSKIVYNIAYTRRMVEPASCEATMTKSEDPTEVIIGVSENFCQNGNFSGLLSNTEYVLTVTSNGEVNHNLTLSTGFYRLDVRRRDLNTISFDAVHNLTRLPTFCRFIDQSTGMDLLCPGDTCFCSSDTFSMLDSSVTYNTTVVGDETFIANSSFTTASPASSLDLTFEPEITTFTIGYPEGAYRPSRCGHCLMFTDDYDFNQCRSSASSGRSAGVCQGVAYLGLNYETSVHLTVFDGQNQVVGDFDEIIIPNTGVNQTGIRLTSVEYLLNTVVEYDPNLPCQFSFSNVNMSCLVNGTQSQNCPCASGNLVSLSIDAFFRDVRVYQGSKYIAYTPLFGTAYKGSFSVSGIGINSVSYSIRYGLTNSYPSDYCFACVLPEDSISTTCDESDRVEGSDVCFSYIFSDLSTNLQYKLLIFDGDGEDLASADLKTSDIPIEASFNTEESLLNYTLIYGADVSPPTVCSVYFKEDPLFEVQCQVPGCTCLRGVVILPSNTTLTNIVVVDGFGSILADSSPRRQTLSPGAIVGIVIAIIVVLVVIITVTVVLLKKK